MPHGCQIIKGGKKEEKFLKTNGLKPGEYLTTATHFYSPKGEY